MPIFEFLCSNPKCIYHKKRFELRLSFYNMDAAVTCTKCGCQMERCVVLSSPASFRMGGAK